jgi:hypothetical protein
MTDGSGVLAWKQIDEFASALKDHFNESEFRKVVRAMDGDPDDVMRMGTTFPESLTAYVTDLSRRRLVDKLVKAASETNHAFKWPVDPPPPPPAPKRAKRTYQLGHDEQSRGNVPGLSYGKLGAIHMHVDGSRAQELFDNIVERHKKDMLHSEMSHIVDSCAGPQRNVWLWDQTYKAHTPGLQDGVEGLDAFSTTRLFGGPKPPSQKECLSMRATIRDVLTDLYHYEESGGVLELERVVATVDESGKVTMADPFELEPTDISALLDDGALLFKQERFRSKTYELHFSVNISRCLEDKPGVVQSEQPLELQELVDACERRGIPIGGWFLFFDAERWAYRSNAFAEEVAEVELRRIWQALREELQTRLGTGGNWTIRLLAERCLALWRCPLKEKKTNKSILTVRELAEWEASVDDGDFWVVAPNFLGDQDEAVKSAMKQNLGRGVHYTYFLRSNADAMRWLAFKTDLENEKYNVKDQLKACVISFGKWNQLGNRFEFIANPGTDKQSAMQLMVDELSQKVYAGSPMGPRLIETAVGVLKPLLDARPRGELREVLETLNIDSMAVMYFRFSDELCPTVAESFDKNLAIAISKSQGEVFSSDADCLVVGFPGRGEAVSRAVNFTSKLKSMISPDGYAAQPLTIGIDCGHVQRATRSYGMEWEGSAVKGASDTLKLAMDTLKLAPSVFLSKNAADELRKKETRPQLKRIRDDLYELETD